MIVHANCDTALVHDNYVVVCNRPIDGTSTYRHMLQYQVPEDIEELRFGKLQICEYKHGKYPVVTRCGNSIFTDKGWQKFAMGRNRLIGIVDEQLFTYVDTYDNICNIAICIHEFDAYEGCYFKGVVGNLFKGIISDSLYYNTYNEMAYLYTSDCRHYTVIVYDIEHDVHKNIGPIDKNDASTDTAIGTWCLINDRQSIYQFSFHKRTINAYDRRDKCFRSDGYFNVDWRMFQVTSCLDANTILLYDGCHDEITHIAAINGIHDMNDVCDDMLLFDIRNMSTLRLSEDWCAFKDRRGEIMQSILFI